MEDDTRGCIAYIAGRIISGREASSVMDNLRAKTITIGGTVTPEKVDVFDYTRSSSVKGKITDGFFNLFDSASGKYIQLRVTGSTFKGHDFHTVRSYTGTVSGRTITIRDDSSPVPHTYTL